MDILKLIKEKAQEKINKILLVEGEDERIVKGASMAVEEKICNPILLGNKETIIKAASKKNANLDGITILDYKNHPELDEFAEKLAELRKHKGLTVKEAKELLKNPNYFGALMVKLGKADGAVGGCKFSTADWMRPVFQIIGRKKGVSVVSGCVIVMYDDKPYFISDSDFNIVPDSGQLAQIAINAAGFAKGLGVKPKIALLSYSTKGSGEHPSLEKIREALEIVKEKKPELAIDGELQFDVAVDPSHAKRKCPDSIIQGDANVLIVPDITSANILIHFIDQWTEYKFYGTFALGLEKPVGNGGRGFTPEQVKDLIASCAMQCNLK